MMKALYTAATGMQAQQARIDNIANNLANVATTGFKKTRASFEDLVYQSTPVPSAGSGARRGSTVQLGSGVRLDGTIRDMSPGDLVQTSNPLDIALTGRGFFVLEAPDGTVRYTRDGQFEVNADGEVVGGPGYALSPGISIPDDTQGITIDSQGEVWALYPSSAEPVSLGTIELADFVNPAGLRAVGGNLYEVTAESGEALTLDPADGTTTIQQSYLETSNVDVAEELVEMIAAQRSYELTSKAIQAADEALGVVASLKR